MSGASSGSRRPTSRLFGGESSGSILRRASTARASSKTVPGKFPAKDGKFGCGDKLSVVRRASKWMATSKSVRREIPTAAQQRFVCRFKTVRREAVFPRRQSGDLVSVDRWCVCLNVEAARFVWSVLEVETPDIVKTVPG